MKLSKAILAACGALLATALLLFSACEGFFTTSVASALARDIDYSSLSLDELAKLAASRGTTNSEEAKKILAALASMKEEELKGLTVEQKEAILNTAVNASFSIDTILDLAQSAQDDDTEDIITEVFNIANSGVDMTAVKTILSDEDTLQAASVDTLILASAALIISVGDEDTVNAVAKAIESGNTNDLNDLGEDLVETAEIIIDVVKVLEEDRSEELDAFASSFGFDLSSIISGLGD